MTDPRLCQLLRQLVSASLLASLGACAGGPDDSNAPAAETGGAVDATAPAQNQGTDPVATGSTSPASGSETPTGPEPLESADAVKCDAGINPSIDFEPAHCTGDGLALEGLAAENGLDFLALRATGDLDEPDLGPMDGGTLLDVHTFGVPCGGASEEADCLARLERTGPDASSSWVTCEPSGCVLRALVGTAGDAVRRWQTQEELLELIGPVDKAVEAALLVWANGYAVECGDAERWATREVDDGFEVLATNRNYDDEMRAMFHVSRDGSVVMRCVMAP